jgi:hypothetical protein
MRTIDNQIAYWQLQLLGTKNPIRMKICEARIIALENAKRTERPVQTTV